MSTDVSKLHRNEILYFFYTGKDEVFTMYHVHMQYSVVGSL